MKKILVVLFVMGLMLAGCRVDPTLGNSNDLQSLDTDTTIEEASAVIGAGEENEASVQPIDKGVLDAFFSAYIERGSIDSIKDLADEFGVFVDKKNTGTGRYYYKVALTIDDARVISLSDLTTGEYCIVIDGGEESLTYYNNVDLYEIHYSNEGGFYIHDKCRLTPFDNGTFNVSVDGIESALAYKPSVETDISPMAQLYIEAEIGMDKEAFKELLDKYGLALDYRRSNSDDGIVYYVGDKTNKEYETCIYFVLRDTLEDLDYYDYYVKTKYGVSLEYITEIEISTSGGDYSETGYYIVGDGYQEYYTDAEMAVNSLREYRNIE